MLEIAGKQIDKPLCVKTRKAAAQRVGEIYFHPKYGEFLIIEYHSEDKVKIRFSNTKYEYYTSYSHIKNFEVCDKYSKGVYGNYHGEGRANKQAYKTWYNMLFRCYNSSCYKDVKVCEEWYNYSAFEEWYERQYKENRWHLDKDILSNGNGLYSPDTCCFLPPEINTFFAKFKKAKGYSYNKRKKRYEAYCRNNGKYIHLGIYDTQEAAREAYLNYKRELFEEIFRPYADVISKRVYESMSNFLW